MWNIRGLHRKGLAEREEKWRVRSSERAHKQILAVKKNMHLILNSSTGTLVTVFKKYIFCSPGCIVLTLLADA